MPRDFQIRALMPGLLWGATATLFGLLLSSLFRAENVPLLPILGLVSLAGLTTLRASAGLILVALLVPVAMWFGREWNWAVAWPETLVVAFLLGYAARRTIEPGREKPTALNLALLSMIVLVVASLLVQLLVMRETIGGDALRAHLWQTVSVHYFVGDGDFHSIDAAMRLIEGLLLLHASAALAGASSGFPPRFSRAIVMGAVLSSAFNLWRIWVGALRLDEPILAFLRYLVTLRFNTHYSDINAAGSYYVMALLPALALARESRRWMAAAFVIALSLILTGSRTAIIAGIIAAATVWWIGRARRPHRDHGAAPTRTTRVVAALLLALACGAVLYAAVWRNVTTTNNALWSRREFASTAVRMLASRPVFGVGVGEYYPRSGEFTSPQMRALYPLENAHNNFLQILAELGLTGFAAFVWVLGLTASGALRLLSAKSDEFLPAGVAAGVLAFVVTWLASHPLLVDPPAFTFWMVLGMVAGWGATAGIESNRKTPGDDAAGRVLVGGRRRHWLSAALLITLAMSVPFRTRHEIGAANLEHRGIGLSGWHTSADGIQYRLAGVTSTIFIPSDAAVVTLPLRSMVANDEFDIQLHLDGRNADVVRVPADSWRTLSIQLPERSDGRRFRALQLTVRDGGRREPPLLMVGKVQTR